MDNVYSVKIAGRELRIVTDEEKEYVEGLAGRLSALVTETVMETGGATRYDAALLCALSAMDEAEKAQGMLRKLREDNARLIEQLNRARNNNGRR